MDFGAGQFIWRLGDPAVEGYVAASDPRRDGAAVGLLSGDGATAAADARPRVARLALATVGAIAFSGKAIIVKLTYRHGVDAVHGDHAAHAVRAAAVRGAGLVGRARQAGVHAARLARRGRPGLLRLLPGQLPRLPRACSTSRASLERLILYLNPTLVLLLGGAAGCACAWRAADGWRLRVSYAGVLLVFGHELSLEGADVALGAALVFGSALSYAVYLVYSGEVVRRIGALRLTGAGHQRGLRAVHRAVSAAAPAVGGAAVPEPVLWLSLLNAVLCTFAPVLMVMMAIERIGATLAAQAGMVGPMSTILIGVVLARRTLHRLGGGRHSRWC